MSEEGKKAALAIAEQMRLLREAVQAFLDLDDSFNVTPDHCLDSLARDGNRMAKAVQKARIALAKAGPR